MGTLLGWGLYLQLVEGGGLPQAEDREAQADDADQPDEGLGCGEGLDGVSRGGDDVGGYDELVPGDLGDALSHFRY